MALGRVYTIDSGLVTVATTAQTCILAGTTSAVQTFYVEALRIGIHSGASVSYPPNGSVLAQLLRSTGAAANGGTATKNPANVGDLAAQSTWLSGSTAITGLTATAVEPWGQELPFTAGSNWGEWWTPGAEIQVPISANLGLWVTCSSAGTATQFKAQLVISE
jgi:hypothetical protein